MSRVRKWQEAAKHIMQWAKNDHVAIGFFLIPVMIFSVLIFSFGLSRPIVLQPPQHLGSGPR